MIVHGGFHGSLADTDLEPPQAQSTMWLWRSETNTWHEVLQAIGDSVSGTLARIDHSLTAYADGGLVMHGGRDLGVGEATTWIGSLNAVTDVDGVTYSCTWSPAPHQGAPRYGHAAFHDEEAGRVVLVGGVAEAEAGFAVALDVDGTGGWLPLGDLGKAQPPARTHAAVAMAADAVVVVGGHAVSVDGAAPEVMSDAWRYDGGANAWSSFEVPDGVPGLAGAFFTYHDGAWILGGGDSAMPVSWRRSWSLDVTELTWLSTGPWPGLPPRTGATVVVRPDTGETWLVGGSRMPGGFPLMDAHAWTPGSTQWQPLADALSPVPNTLDTTRPGLTGASGVWDPVAQAVLLAGGRDVATGQLS
ncbi:MAG: hypothetical protein QF464_19645, partial [Myxococcota bacterium]|nr:hypothetical protein [Myxococcota bacterium]